MLIDTHCHLYLDEFKVDFEKVCQDALENGIEKIVLPNIDSESIESMFFVLKQKTSFLYPTLGLHPTSVNENYQEEIKKIFNYNFENIVAIGEIGIDLYWDKTFLKEQKMAFDYQINLAIEKNLPVIIHSRNSMNEIFDILKIYKNKNLKGIFHCFPGSYEQAKLVVDMGFYLGIGGVLTFKNASLAKVVEKMPLENLVLETDAPYLTPVPFRGKRNEPAYIKIIAEKIAEIKNINFSEVEEKTSENANEIFKL
ncbi:MAG: TatD family hydrolase [Bacteroidales bacterium]|jgi:TatD DNase family protein|nr:TatD family hydrolase [Bacteroidales bacterium]